MTPPPFSASPALAALNFAIVQFSDIDNGWAWDYNEEAGGTGYQLFATHNGGDTWIQITLGQPNRWGIMATGAAAGNEWAVTYSNASRSPGYYYSILGSPVGQDAWTASPVALPLGAGGASGLQIVSASGRGWIVDDDRGTLAGAALSDQMWTTWTPPCQGGGYGDAELAAVSASYLVAYCPPNLDLGNEASPAALFASGNGGQSFQQVAATLPSSVSTLAASPGGALFCFDSQGIAASFDGGATWRTVLDLPPTPVLYEQQGVTITFATSAVGYASTVSGELFKTVDGGQSWQPVSLPST